MVSRRFGYNDPNFKAEAPGCQFVSGSGFVCGRLDAGSVSLPPGTWEVTAQVLADSTAAYVLADNRRELTCSPAVNPRLPADDQLRVLMTETVRDYRPTWTWIVTNAGPDSLAWNLGCVTSYPLFSSFAEKTDSSVAHAVIIARPVASVIES